MANGFGKIIVGAEVERLDAILDGVERRQNQHRRARTRRACRSCSSVQPLRFGTIRSSTTAS